MKTVGIICEYNPFHLGHRIQIQDIRNRLMRGTVPSAVPAPLPQV